MLKKLILGAALCGAIGAACGWFLLHSIPGAIGLGCGFAGGLFGIMASLSDTPPRT